MSITGDLLPVSRQQDVGEQQQPLSPRKLTGLLKSCLSNQQPLFFFSFFFLELDFIYPLCRTEMIEARSFPCNWRGKNRNRAPFVITARVYVARIVAPQSLQSNTEVFSVNTHANQLLWPHPVSVFNRTNMGPKGKPPSGRIVEDPCWGFITGSGFVRHETFPSAPFLDSLSSV